MESLGGTCRTKKNNKIWLAQVIYEKLCIEISSGHLRPGELLSRRRVAKHFGVSQTPVVEAMIRLENSGLIEMENAQMARVRWVSEETIKDTAALREALETQAIRLACAHALPEEVEELSRLAQDVDHRRQVRDTGKDSKEGDPEGAGLHNNFHLRIAQVGRRPALVRELVRLQLVRRLESVWNFVPANSMPVPLHIWLVEAIASRDAEAADRAMRNHVQRSLKKELLGSGQAPAEKNDIP